MLAAFSPQLSRLLDYRRYQTTTIDKMQKQLAMQGSSRPTRQIMLVRPGFIGAVTLISSAPLTPSRLILFKMAMRMSGQRRRSLETKLQIVYFPLP